jgi:glycosyltransferase involved in cell wall biosynthesis
MGVSDAWTGVLAHNISSRIGARLAIDAYDDYEAYMAWNLPLHWLWRNAIAAADLTTAAGPQLASLMNRHRYGRNPTRIVHMVADPQFVPMHRIECRLAIGLPVDFPIIGYSGGWSSNRGTESLIKAYHIIRKSRPDVLLALTGTPPKNVLGQPGIHALGYLEDDQMPLFLNALNVSSVITTDSRFGKSSYPSKLCEALACDVPIVATATEPVKWMLKNNTDYLVEINNPEALACALMLAIDQDRNITSHLQSNWQQQAALLNTYLE